MKDQYNIEEMILLVQLYQQYSTNHRSALVRSTVYPKMYSETLELFSFREWLLLHETGHSEEKIIYGVEQSTIIPFSNN